MDVVQANVSEADSLARLLNEELNEKKLADVETLEEEYQIKVLGDLYGLNDEVLDKLMADFQVEFADFDSLNYVDLGLESLLQPDTDFKELLSADKIDFNLSSETEKSKVSTEKESQIEKLTIEDSRNVQSENETIYIPSAEPTSQSGRSDIKTTMEIFQEHLHLGDESQSTAEELVSQLNDSSRNYSIAGEAGTKGRPKRKRVDVTWEPPESDSFSSETKHKMKDGERARKRIHKEVESYVCNKCNRRFNLKSHLVTHLHTHFDLGEKPYHREVYDIEDLGEKPYHCEVCERAFSQSCDLSRHLRTHYTEKPFKCNHLAYAAV